MANSKTKPVKLQQLLEEQQEPFVLDVYLVERGYLRKSLNSDRRFSCCPANSRRSFRRSINQSLSKRNKCIPHSSTSKVLRAVYDQVIAINKRLRNKPSNDRDGPHGEINVSEKGRNNQVPEIERFSSASCTTVFNSCSGSDAEETSTSLPKNHISFTGNISQSSKHCNPIEIEIKQLLWRRMDNSKQLSPVSALEGIPPHGGSPLHNKAFDTMKEEKPSKSCVIFPKKIAEASILSASLWKILVQSTTEKPICARVTETQEILQSNPSSKHFKSKTNLEQTKQLLFDYVGEVVKTQGRREKQQVRCKKFLGSEELGKSICEKIRSWGKQSGDESHLTKLLGLDLLDSAQKWRGFEPQQRDIESEIGDTIWEQIMDEVVMDMINSDSPITRC